MTELDSAAVVFPPTEYAAQHLDYVISRPDGAMLTAEDRTRLENDLDNVILDFCEAHGYAMNGGTLPLTEEELNDPVQDVADLPLAARDILAERQRQREVEGWTPEHDDQHTDGSLARAAACYAVGNPVVGNLSLWPSSWTLAWWKPTSRRRNLIKAAALILAEVERLDRLEARNER